LSAQLSLYLAKLMI